MMDESIQTLSGQGSEQNLPLLPTPTPAWGDWPANPPIGSSLRLGVDIPVLDFFGKAIPGPFPDHNDTHAVSFQESRTYYAGIPSRPILLYRTGKAWFPPTGPEAYTRYKDLWPVFNHPIVHLWDTPLSSDVVAIWCPSPRLDSFFQHRCGAVQDGR